MKEAFEIAQKKIRKAAGYNKQYFDRKAKADDLSVGGRLLVQNGINISSFPIAALLLKRKF